MRTLLLWLTAVAFCAAGEPTKAPPAQMITIHPTITVHVAQGGVGIDGPSVAAVGETVHLKMTGVPDINLNLPLGDQLKWTQTMAMCLLPENGKGKLEAELAITMFPLTASVRLNFSASEAGAYFIVLDWNEEPRQLVTHQITVGGTPPPPPPPPGELTADIVDVTPNPHDGPVGQVAIKFSEAVTGFDMADLELVRAGAVQSLEGVSLLGGPQNFAVDLSTVTTKAGLYTLKVKAAGSGIRGAASGRQLSADADDSFLVNINPPQPTTLHVTLICERADQIASQGQVWNSKAVRDWFGLHPGSRFWVADQDAKGPDGQTPPELAPDIAKAKATKLPRLFIRDTADKVLWEDSPPAKAADFIALLKQWGGE